jgi:hypothetical protein
MGSISPSMSKYAICSWNDYYHATTEWIAYKTYSKYIKHTVNEIVFIESEA